MSIALNCPHCGKAFRVLEEHAGRRSRCSSCGGAIQIPSLPPVTPPGPPPTRVVEPPKPQAPARPPIPMTIEQPRDPNLPRPTGPRPAPRRTRRPAADAFDAPRLGLLLLVISGGILLFAIAGRVLLAPVIAALEGEDLLRGINLYFTALVVLSGVIETGLILGLVGRVQSARVPIEPTPVTLGRAGVILSGLGLLFWTLVMFSGLVLRFQNAEGFLANSGNAFLYTVVDFGVPLALLLTLAAESCHAGHLAVTLRHFERPAGFAGAMRVALAVLALLSLVVTVLDFTPSLNAGGDVRLASGDPGTLETSQLALLIALAGAIIGEMVLLLRTRRSLLEEAR